MTTRGHVPGEQLRRKGDTDDEPVKEAGGKYSRELGVLRGKSEGQSWDLNLGRKKNKQRCEN